MRYKRGLPYYICEIMLRKKSPLENILKIEKDIDLIKKDTTYLRIRKGLKTIDDFNQGARD